MFVQIGRHAFNHAHIVIVNFWRSGDGATVIFNLPSDSQNYEAWLEFSGTEFDAFLDWWETSAEVRKMEVE